MGCVPFLSLSRKCPHAENYTKQTWVFPVFSLDWMRTRIRFGFSKSMFSLWKMTKSWLHSAQCNRKDISPIKIMWNFNAMYWVGTRVTMFHNHCRLYSHSCCYKTHTCRSVYSRRHRLCSSVYVVSSWSDESRSYTWKLRFRVRTQALVCRHLQRAPASVNWTRLYGFSCVWAYPCIPFVHTTEIQQLFINQKSFGLRRLSKCCLY